MVEGVGVSVGACYRKYLNVDGFKLQIETERTTKVVLFRREVAAGPLGYHDGAGG